MARTRHPAQKLGETEEELRAEVQRRFEEYYKRKGLTQDQAAQQIGISRTAFIQYLNGSITPKSHVLLRACKEWGIRIQYDNVEFGIGTTNNGHHGAKEAHGQLSLFDAIDALNDEQIEVHVHKKGPSNAGFELLVGIKFAS